MEDKIILLVEDNLDDVELTLHAFRKNKIKNTIIVVNDGAEALDFLFGTGQYMGRDLSVMPTLVLLDIQLPKVDGFQVLKELRANNRTQLIPVVILTSSKEEQDLFNSYRLGVNSYIRKPVDFFAFSEVVKNLGLYWLLFNEVPSQKNRL